MEPGIAETLPPLIPEPKVLRVLWRMQRPSKVIVARVERHLAGRELVIAFDDDDDVIETRLERFDFGALEQRAADLRSLLEEKGWVSLRIHED